MDKIFQIGLVLAIPAVSYVYSQGVNESTANALNNTISELNHTVKELSATTSQLSNNTAVLTAQAQRNEQRLDILEAKVDQTRMDLSALKRK